MLGRIFLLNFFSDCGILPFCKALSTLGACRLLCFGAFNRGAQHLGGLSPKLAVSCSRSQVPALVLFEEKAITEAGRSTQNVKWNKFEEYIRNREWGAVQEAGMKEGGWLVASLMAAVPQCFLLQSLPPSVSAFPVGSLPSGLQKLSHFLPSNFL